MTAIPQLHRRTLLARMAASLTCALAFASLVAHTSAPAIADVDIRTAPAVLLMVQDPGCPYCARWMRDVHPGYSRSAEGRFAPLVRRMRGDSDVAFLGQISYSPTFIILTHGREIGRIVGYAGPDLFWMQVAELFQKAGFVAPKGS